MVDNFIYNMKKRSIILFIIAIVCSVGLAIFFYLDSHQTKKAMQEYEALAEYERQELENEYSDLALEMEGVQLTIDNDSLLVKLDVEKQRVQNLLAELRTVKSSNARRITELKKELASVRKVLVYYVQQVDSLNMVNAQLEKENRSVRTKMRQATQQVTQLKDEKAGLEEKVKLASQLEAINIEVRKLNKRGKKTGWLRRTKKIEIAFTIAKNISSSVGNKICYARIMTPDGQVLQKSLNTLFDFEDSQIAYSCKREFEYASEALPLKLFWDVHETLLEGDYRVNLFVDGHMIGETFFTIK